jgi:SIR2-like domain
LNVHAARQHVLVASRLDALKGALLRAQMAADAIGDEPVDEPEGLGYFAGTGLQDVIDKIAEHEGDITVFAGAGVSMEAGLPSWNTLITRLLVATADEQLDDDQLDLWVKRTLAEGPLAAAAIAKALHGDEDAFKVALREALYYPFDPRAYGPGALAGQIAALKVKLGARLRILTVNYDGLLEAALEAAETPADPYVKAEIEKEGRAAVWHLHGRLMRRATGASWRTTGKLILAEGDYVKSTYGTFPQNWVADCLENTLCLFVGLSMTDPNFIRWLYTQGADPPHPRFAVFVRQGSSVPDDKVRAMLERAAAARWRMSGVTPVWGNYYGEVAQMLHEVGLRIDDPQAEEFPNRAAHRLAAARAAFLPDDHDAFLHAQSFLSEWLRDRLVDVRAVAGEEGVDLGGHRLGLGLWGVDHDSGVVEQWALSHRELRERDAVERRPMHFDSRWIAVAAVINGASVEQDPAVYTSRWRLVRGIPVTVSPTTARSVAGALTLTSTIPLAENPLSRRNALPGLLHQIDAMLVEAAAELFQ